MILIENWYQVLTELIIQLSNCTSDRVYLKRKDDYVFALKGMADWMEEHLGEKAEDYIIGLRALAETPFLPYAQNVCKGYTWTLTEQFKPVTWFLPIDIYHGLMAGRQAAFKTRLYNSVQEAIEDFIQAWTKVRKVKEV